MKTLRRKLRTVWRYLFPTAEDQAYLTAIRAGKGFDRAFYLSSNPGLKRVFHLWPERHYVQLGEAQGCCPNPRFSPRAYLFHHPELADERHPYWHYLRHEAPAAPSTPRPAPVMPRVQPEERVAQAPQALVVHLYYLDLWPEIEARFSQQSLRMDLLVTLTEAPEAPALAARIRQSHPGARVWILPNHGRDIWPFVWLINQGLLAPYRAVAKVHSKRSPHLAGGDAWRQGLLDAVLGPSDLAAKVDRFCADPRAGLWTQGSQIMRGDKWWGPNRDLAQRLAQRAGLDIPPELSFAAGTMFWIKPEILELLARLALTSDDFGPEEARVDGTTAHAVERLIGALVALNGQEIVPDVQ